MLTVATGLVLMTAKHEVAQTACLAKVDLSRVIAARIQHLEPCRVACP